MRIELPVLQGLRNRPESSLLQITLVDRTDRFVFKPLLYELIQGAATPDEVAPRFEQLLAPYSTKFIQASSAPQQHGLSARLAKSSTSIAL